MRIDPLSARMLPTPPVGPAGTPLPTPPATDAAAERAGLVQGRTLAASAAARLDALLAPGANPAADTIAPTLSSSLADADAAITLLQGLATTYTADAGLMLGAVDRLQAGTWALHNGSDLQVHVTPARDNFGWAARTLDTAIDRLDNPPGNIGD